MNNFHKEFKFFSWQHFSTQRGVVKISLQAVLLYTMMYFRVYWKELGGKFYSRHPKRISISFYFSICQSGLIMLGSFLSLFCKAMHIIMFVWNFLQLGVLEYILILSTNWPCWQVLWGYLRERFPPDHVGWWKGKRDSDLIMGKMSVSLCLFLKSTVNFTNLIYVFVKTTSDSLSCLILSLYI